MAKSRALMERHRARERDGVGVKERRACRHGLLGGLQAPGLEHCPELVTCAAAPCCSLSPLTPTRDQMELLATSSTSSIRMVLGAHTLALPLPWALPFLFLPSSPSRSRGCLPRPSPRAWESKSAAPDDDETEGVPMVVVVGGGGDDDDERPCPCDRDDGGCGCTGHGRLQAPGTMQPQYPGAAGYTGIEMPGEKYGAAGGGLLYGGHPVLTLAGWWCSCTGPSPLAADSSTTEDVPSLSVDPSLQVQARPGVPAASLTGARWPSCAARSRQRQARPGSGGAKLSIAPLAVVVLWRRCECEAAAFLFLRRPAPTGTLRMAPPAVQ